MMEDWRKKRKLSIGDEDTKTKEDSSTMEIQFLNLEEEIKKVERKLDTIGGEIDEWDRIEQQQQEKEETLQDKQWRRRQKETLWAEEEQLWAEEQQLRAKKLIILRTQYPPSASAAAAADNSVELVKLMLPKELPALPANSSDLADILFPPKRGKLPVIPSFFELELKENKKCAKDYLISADASILAATLATILMYPIQSQPKSEMETSIMVTSTLKQAFKELQRCSPQDEII